MNFLYKLFPFKSLIHNDSDSLTAWWVLLTLLFFIFYLIKLIKHTRQLYHDTTHIKNNFNENDIINRPLLKNVWNDYYSSFFDYSGIKKTNDDSYNYFNEANLLHNAYNFRILQSVPNVLVGFGILGTFVGLTAGISGFETSSTKVIQNSIERLLSGMGTAFVSSIWGMGLSILYTFIEKSKINSLHTNINALCNLLDKKYLISKSDERAIQLQSLKDAIAEYFIYKDENNNIVKPANVIRDLYSESQKQSLALQSFSTDLAVKIEAGFENILSNQFQQNISPILDEIKKELQLLSKNVKDPASEMTQAVVSDLKNVMSQMVEDFKFTVAGSTKSEMEKLASILSSTATSITEMPQVLKHTTEQMTKLVEALGNQLNEKVGELQIEQEILIDKQKENINLSDKFIEEINNSISKMNESSYNVTTVLTQFYDLMDMLKTASTNMKSISENVISQSNQLKDSENRLIQHTQTILEKNDITIKNILAVLDQSKNASDEYVQKFNVIEKGLKGIFDQIQKGIIEYSGTIENSVRRNLEEYTKAFTTSSEALSSSANKLEEIMEELTDQLDKFSNGRR